MGIHKVPNRALKLRIYKRALKILIKNECGGICTCIHDAQNDMGLQSTLCFFQMKYSTSGSSRKENLDTMEHNFPEIYKHKPKRKHEDEFWWSPYDDRGHAKRIEILNEAIESCKPKVKL